MPRYGQLNESYVASWFARDEPGGPMWALNLMKYREQAEYADGRDSSISGMEADDVYAPHEHLRKVGSRLIMMAPVVHQLVGDAPCVGSHRDRPVPRPHGHDRDVVERRLPGGRRPQGGRDGLHDRDGHVPGRWRPRCRRRSRAPTTTGSCCCRWSARSASTLDIAADVDSVRIGRFAIEDRILGDDRTFRRGPLRPDLPRRSPSELGAHAARRTATPTTWSSPIRRSTTWHAH